MAKPWSAKPRSYGKLGVTGTTTANNIHQSLTKSLFFTEHKKHVITCFLEILHEKEKNVLCINDFHCGTTIHCSLEIPSQNEENVSEVLHHRHIKSNTLAVYQANHYVSTCIGHKYYALQNIRHCFLWPVKKKTGLKNQSNNMCLQIYRHIRNKIQKSVTK
jgi:hypothetical protein